MPRFPREWLDQLRSRADIIQVISGYMPLKKNGRRYWGLCPFHGEKTASFSADSERQLYYCFGCKASGNVIQFVMDMERLDFSDAVKLLADRYNMPIPQLEEDPDYQRRRDQRDRLYAANKEAARWFHQTLFTEQGKAALDYLKNRGLNDAVIRRFGLGAAPNSWDALTRHLTGMGYTEEELRLSGLCVVKSEEPATENSPARPRRCFDMFRNRAIFPIIDQYGNILAFGGRSIDGSQPKYLNTGDTPIFNKRLNVYAANLLRKERHLDRVVLVEGYMDVVSLNQFGVPGVCATLGTALTQEQARLLKRFAPAVYLSYDGDSAGQHAILRGLDILDAEDIPAKVLDFPDGLDPDEFIRRDGAEGFAALPAISGAAYRIRRLKDEHDLSTQDGRVGFAKACAPILRDMEPVDLEIYLQELMIQTGFTREVLLAQIGRTAPRPSAAQEQSPSAVHPRRETEQHPLKDPLRAQEIIISLMASGRLSGQIAAQQDFSDPLLKRLFTELASGRSAASLVEEEAGSEDRARVTALLLSPPTGEDASQVLSMAKQCLDAMRRSRIDARMKELQSRISTLGPEEKKAAMAEYMQLSKEKQKLRPV